MKFAYLLLLLLGFKHAHAHQPNLSSLVIYEENGKSILLLKSSLEAFKAEVDLYFKKGTYKTAEEFNQLAITHFEKNCVLIVNGDSIRFTNTRMQLGNETTLLAELLKMPKTINSIYIKCTTFKDMPNNMCELILTTNGQQQKQYILDHTNQQQVTFTVENNQWIVDELGKAFYLSPTLSLGLAAMFMVALIIFLAVKMKHDWAVPGF